ncbi:MAG: phosphate signaling complex protein PhoU [Dehalococcoidales bacterium]
MKALKIKLDINFMKVVLGVVFSLVWSWIMYLIWPQPPYIIFVLFYLVAGSIVIKWIFFEIIDRVTLKFRLKAVSKEIDESGTRVNEAVEDGLSGDELQVADTLSDIESFDNKLRLLEQAVLAFGNTVKTAMAQATLSLEEKDVALATKVIKNDNKIDHQRYVLENNCMQLIRTGHPEEKDLRKIVAMLSIVTELERMGDYAEGIAKITLMIGKEPDLKSPAELHNMATRAIEMLEGSLEAFGENNAEKAKLISNRDEQVDKLYDQTFRKLVLFMIGHPKDITKVTWLVWAAHNMERFADRVTNICERVVFSVSGEISTVNVSKY